MDFDSKSLAFKSLVPGGAVPRCPAPAAARGSACPEASACLAEHAAMPREGVERAVMLALRFLAAAAETGDAACWEAAFERAEDEFGPREGALLVARAAALLRALRRDGAAIRFLPPPCRRLSPDEAELLAALRAGPHHRAGRRVGGLPAPGAPGGSLADRDAFPETLTALADLVPQTRMPCGPLPRPAIAAPSGRPSAARGPS